MQTALKRGRECRVVDLACTSVAYRLAAMAVVEQFLLLESAVRVR